MEKKHTYPFNLPIKQVNLLIMNLTKFFSFISRWFVLNWIQDLDPPREKWHDQDPRNKSAVSKTGQQIKIPVLLRCVYLGVMFYSIFPIFSVSLQMLLLLLYICQKLVLLKFLSTPSFADIYVAVFDVCANAGVRKARRRISQVILSRKNAANHKPVAWWAKRRHNLL